MAEKTTVTLTKPLMRGKSEIKDVELREPTAGELRGLKLVDLLNLDINALVTLIPRISTPALTADELRGLSFAQITQLGGGIADFLADAAPSPQA